MSEVSAKPQASSESTIVEDINKSESVAASTEKPKVANDVQRAIEGLKDIPDDELQEFLNDEDFMKDLDVVDAWEGDEDKAKKDARGARTKERGDHAKASRERPRKERKSPYNRDRSKRDERKRDDIRRDDIRRDDIRRDDIRRDDIRRDDIRRDDIRRDDIRRDPSKSSKDIERDKIRTKKDTDSRILAEKEKAIKHLLDSDNVVPPGTEVEAIQNITDKQQNSDRGLQRPRKSRDRRRSRDRSRPSPGRRRSNDRIRLSPHRRISDERRQIRISPERRRNPAGSPSLRRSWERRASRERSIERQRRREEREFARLIARRTRSRERQRSRSSDRYRKRWSRSPIGRRSSPRRSRTRSRTPDRRTRKRSPFINEIARQFEKEGLLPSNFLPGIPPLMAQGQGYQQGQASPVPPPLIPPFMHHPGPPRPSGMQHMQGGPQFVNFEPRPPLGPPINFDPGRGTLLPMPQPDYTAGPVMYGQGNSPGIMQLPGRGPAHLPMPMHSPQPVPAPGPMDTSSMGFNQTRCIVNIPATTQQPQPEPTNRRPASPRMPYPEHKSASTSNYHIQRPERLKTPEPPIISNSKPFEKTSLSSLLEASVSAKDSHGPPVLYPGFKPEILRHCEQALRELPTEDQRLKLKGRFFFDPSKEDSHIAPEEVSSNSILLRTGRNKIYWEESEKILAIPDAKPTVETHQKICQTDDIETVSRSVQAHIRPMTSDFCMQVSPFDLQQAAKEEKRPIMDRLDWNVRETYDYAPKIREADDLRWSLSNSSQKRAWNNRGVSPVRVIEEERELSPVALSTSDHGSRGMHVGSSTRSRDHFSFHRSSSREHYSHDRFSPTYRGSIDRQEEFHESRSDRSRGESPMVLEDSPDEIEILDERYPRSSDYRTRGKSNYGPPSALQKLRALRGKIPGRSHRGRGGSGGGGSSFRGKF